MRCDEYVAQTPMTDTSTSYNMDRDGDPSVRGTRYRGPESKLHLGKSEDTMISEGIPLDSCARCALSGVSSTSLPAIPDDCNAASRGPGCIKAPQSALQSRPVSGHSVRELERVTGRAAGPTRVRSRHRGAGHALLRPWRRGRGIGRACREHEAKARAARGGVRESSSTA